MACIAIGLHRCSSRIRIYFGGVHLMKHIHLIGIGGTGLSAIARVLLEEGYTISGSDRTESPLFDAITAAGARTFLDHAGEHVMGADLVIRSSAVPDDNPEVVAANNAGIPVLKRSEFLPELTQDKDILAIAGSHGKTTTTAMLVWVLDQLGIDPSFIAGGVINQLECNAHAGRSRYFAIEADEYDYMFLGLSPKVAVVTNIEHDHPDCFPTSVDYRAAFRSFLERVRPDGLALVCSDDPEARTLIEEMRGSAVNVLTYGTSPGAAYRVDEIAIVDGFPEFRLLHQTGQSGEEDLGRVRLRVPGRHNVLNAAAVLAVMHQLGFSLHQAINILGTFTGAGRRFEVLGEAGGVTVIDDYGHHPTQIAVTLDAARSRYPQSRLWAVWEPHTYSRTQMLEDAFIQALTRADRVIVLKIYAAREVNPGYSSEKIAAALPDEKARYFADFNAAGRFLLENLAPGDVLVTFSAGNATDLSRAVLNGLAMKTDESRNG
jgi:UDP-N-acetylmuramate--alanine ligase